MFPYVPAFQALPRTKVKMTLKRRLDFMLFRPDTDKDSLDILLVMLLIEICIGFFFFPAVWPIRTRLGPYNCVSSEKQECTRTRVVQKLWQIITTNKQQQNHHNQKRPANPPARFAFRHKANSEATKNGAGPNKTKNTFRFALDTVTVATVSASKTCKLIIHCGSA